MSITRDTGTIAEQLRAALLSFGGRSEDQLGNRRSVRVTGRGAVLDIEYNGAPVRAWCVNASKEGFAVEFPHAIPVNRKARVRLSGPLTADWVEVLVVHCTPDAHGFRIGMECPR